MFLTTEIEIHLTGLSLCARLAIFTAVTIVIEHLLLRVKLDSALLQLLGHLVKNLGWLVFKAWLLQECGDFIVCLGDSNRHDASLVLGDCNLIFL